MKLPTKELLVLLNNLKAGVFRNTSGLKGRFIFYNNALLDIFGYTSDEMEELFVSDLYYVKEERKHFENEIKLAGGIILNKRLKLKKNNGDILFCDVTSKAGYHKNGRVSHYDGIILDVTNQVEIYDNISHQILTPILGIKHSVEKIISENIDKEKSKLLLFSIRGCAKTAHYLTRNMNYMSTILNYSKESFTDNLNYISASHIIHNIIIDLQEYAVQEKGMKIEADSQSLDNMNKMRIDERAFMMIVFCLIDNAIKYGFQDTIIKIWGSDSLRFSTLHFQNEGIPLNSYDIKSIFNKRTRGEYAKSYVPAGTGLGLYFAKCIMELHGGKILVEPSKRYMTEFRLLFPRIK